MSNVRLRRRLPPGRWDYTQEQWDEWFLIERGGDQGDYREGMQAKIANVIDCLASHS